MDSALFWNYYRRIPDVSKHEQIVRAVAPGSIAEELEIRPGDIILAINGQEIEDVFDYQFLIEDEYVEMLVRTAEGEEVLLEIEKEEHEDIGLAFDSSLMDDYRSCSNKCIFCFIDQLPDGMRETMYFKDDDSRLSFLQGNYITLTNMKDKDLDRLIRYRLEPINISVHTTNPELRCKMLCNRFAGRIMDQLRKLSDNGIVMNGQIVLCKGINDGKELDRTIRDLSGFLPYMESLSVVPVGLSDHRKGLYPLKPFGKEDAIQVIELIESWQKRLYPLYGKHFVHASDEWYILAERDLPEEDRYDGYLQLENGVGMLRLLITEFQESLDEHDGDERKRHVSIATGRLAGPFIRLLADNLCKKYPNICVDVHIITNHFFGSQITVSGLLTGSDIISQLRGKDLGDTLLLPVNVLRSGEQVLLDDITVADIEKALQIPVTIVGNEGKDLISSILGKR